MHIRSIFLCAVVGELAGSLALAEPQRMEWYRNYESAQTAATSRGLPLLLHFYADWCGPCRRMEENVLNSEAVLAEGATIIAAKINADLEPDVVDRLSVEGFPTDILLSPQGEVLMRRAGYATASEYAALIREHVKARNATQPVVAWDTPIKNDFPLGLEGFSPVSITRDRVWRRGSSEYSWSYRGVVYQLFDAEELQAFEAHPNRFVPRLGGYDPFVLVTANERVQGDIHHGTFYRDGLYLHASRENRQRFIESAEEITNRAESALSTESRALSWSDHQSLGRRPTASSFLSP